VFPLSVHRQSVEEAKKHSGEMLTVIQSIELVNNMLLCLATCTAHTIFCLVNPCTSCLWLLAA
jgi:hypothetical protein